MPAYFETGMYVGATPWHGLGTYVGEEGLRTKGALKRGDLLWTVSKRPLFSTEAVVQSDEVESTPFGSLNLKDYRAIVRDTDNSAYGIVKEFVIGQEMMILTLLKMTLLAFVLG